MSIEISLNEDDYKNIVTWYELAFSKKNNSKESDDKTLSKISLMGLAYLKELKQMEQDEE